MINQWNPWSQSVERWQWLETHGRVTKSQLDSKHWGASPTRLGLFTCFFPTRTCNTWIPTTYGHVTIVHSGWVTTVLKKHVSKARSWPFGPMFWRAVGLVAQPSSTRSPSDSESLSRLSWAQKNDTDGEYGVNLLTFKDVNGIILEERIVFFFQLDVALMVQVFERSLEASDKS